VSRRRRGSPDREAAGGETPDADASHDHAGERPRLDKWLWAARFYKTRSLAAEAVDKGKVSVNGERAKPARHVALGDEVRLRHGPFEHVIHVRGLASRRGPAREAAALYEETAESHAARERMAAHLRNMTAGRFESGRPTKKDRRDLEAFLAEWDA
jgi:ribosome-associated heat shock protein Hsp15